LQKADRVLAISRFTADLVQKAGVDPSRIDIIHVGCDATRFRPLSARMELRQKLLGDRYRNRVILTVGNLVSRKGHDMVIRALPRLRETVPDITYLVVGDGPHRQQLEALADAVGVRDRVVFAGGVPDSDLPDIYALSDVFAMPSREHVEQCDVEGFGLVFLEANACAKPVVGGRSGGIPEAIEDGATGFLVNPNDSEDIAHAIGRLLTDTSLAIRMGQQGRVRVVNHFTWQKIGDRVQEILDAILQERLIRT
jgi:phosphatidyl-myo-inositol dimannoside synthase